MLNYKLLTEFTLNNSILFEKRGYNAEVTDLAILLGAKYKYKSIFKPNEKQTAGYYGEYFADGIYEDKILYIDSELKRKLANYNDRFISIRPMAFYEYFDNINVSGKAFEKNDGIIEFEYGYYPQQAAWIGIQRELENALYENKLKKTGKLYYFCSPNSPVPEYTLHDRKYVRVQANFYERNTTQLSNEITYNNMDFVWIEVQPIEWLVDRKYGFIISKKLLLAGKPYNDKIIKNEEGSIPKISKYIMSTLSDDINNSVSEKDCEKMGNLIHTVKESEVTNIIEDKPKKESNKFPTPIIKKEFKTGIILNDNDFDKDPSFGREKEILELEKMLVIPKKGVILVGDAGVGKTAIVEGLAYRIKQNKACKLLQNKSILSVSINSLIAGTKYRGDFEAKVEKLCEEIIDDTETILFLDEIHTSVKTDNNDNNSLDLCNILKPYISNRNLKVIGCTTTEEFGALSSDKAFRRRFNVLEIKELEDQVVIDILKNNIYNNEFNIKIDANEVEIENFCKLIIKLSKRVQKHTYESGHNPDASLNILMYCFAYLAVSNIEKAKMSDFIEGLMDNPNITLTEIESDNYFRTFEQEPQKKLIKCTKTSI